MPQLKFKKSCKQENAEMTTEFISAVGKRKGLKTETVRLYAETIAAELQPAAYIGQNSATATKDIQAAKEAVAAANSAMQKLSALAHKSFEVSCLHSEIANSMRLEADYEATFAVQFEPHLENIESDLSGQPDIEIALTVVIDYLQRFQKNMTELKTPKEKRGPNNKAPLSIAKMLAMQYAKFFDETPTRGRGDIIGHGTASKARKTPYDRICDVATKHCGFKISDATRKQAIYFVKKMRGELSKK